MGLTYMQEANEILLPRRRAIISEFKPYLAILYKTTLQQAILRRSKCCIYLVQASGSPQVVIVQSMDTAYKHMRDGLTASHKPAGKGTRS